MPTEGGGGDQIVTDVCMCDYVGVWVCTPNRNDLKVGTVVVICHSGVC